ncbi:MAG: 5'-methylthioadenosine/adenosylhomocysteine nucleosidase [Eubacteriales bacterium]|nr:5'-methylthioadenosine/adenosylhomocysteine nucleosidase [Eubacteriales bacterium]
MNKVDIGIIGAMKIEVEAIQAVMEDKKERIISGILFISGKLYGKDIVVAECGIGKVFAAICAEAMILTYNPDVIINTGVAGGLSPKLKIGDIAVSTSVVQHDMDTSPLGDPLGLLSGINIVNIPTDDKTRESIVKAVEELGINCVQGVIASGDQFVNSADKKQMIVDTFDGIACEMEGASISHVCYVNKLPCCVVRSISDGADDDSHMDYPEFCKLAAKNSTAVIKAFVQQYK